VNVEKIEELANRVRSLPDANARNAALELIQAVMDLHAGALERMLEITAAADPESKVIDAFVADDLVSSLLLLHDLHPLDLTARVQRALDQPAFRARGAHVELVSIENDFIRVRIAGGAGLRNAVEQALSNAAPDAAGIAIEGGQEGAPAADFVPLAQLLAT